MIPLSTRMRPERLEEFIGQESFLYKGSLLYNAIKNKSVDSCIFFGPSGTGKTTLARIIAKSMDAQFVELNASLTGTKELRSVLDNAKLRLEGLEARATYLYVDEIHRWNKLQQDGLLKALEDGSVKLIGSTTENPYFSINNAIISRVGNIYQFRPLSKSSLVNILKNAIDNTERGLGNLAVNYDEEAVDMLAEMSNGDARVCLDMLGFIVNNLKEPYSITKQIIGEALQRKIDFYSRGDDKYNLLSALQKSIRGSDPDAAIHYFARLIDGGADIQTIGRRLLVMASEDVGMAYPSAISIVESCVSAALMVGMPEAVINLSQAVILLASSPKSNSACLAYNRALEDIRSMTIDDVPWHLQDSHSIGNQKMGKGKGYLYPHDFGGYVKQQYLPDNLYLKGVKYYEPTSNGSEAGAKKYLEGLKAADGNKKSK